MESIVIKSILEQFDSSSGYKKIFINGSWGIGKSYYTNLYIKEHEDNTLYLSLFGKTSFESILSTLSNELINKLNKYSIFKKATKNVEKKVQDLEDINIHSPAINNKTIFLEFTKRLDSDLIIIIDDLERKSTNIPIENIMGFIEELSWISKVKIVIIGDEVNIGENDKLKWEKFKEKIIEKEYKITYFSEEAIESMVINKLSSFISKEKLKEFIYSFLAKHKTKNLRTINKGINLFFEIVNIYVKEEFDEKVYLTILKNCMAVAIEYTEELYKSSMVKEDKYDISYNIPKRIINNYFNTDFMNHKDSAILDYVIDFYNSNTSIEMINEFNNVLKNYISVKDEKNLFYLKEDEIKFKVSLIYNNIISEKYIVKTIEQFIDEIYNVLIWNKVFSLKYELEDLAKHVNNLLFKYYYDVAKDEEHNKISTFNIIKYDSKSLTNILNRYNNGVSLKYVKDKIDIIENAIKRGDFNPNCLAYLLEKFKEPVSTKIKDYFFNKCKSNKFFLPNLEEELTEDEWTWTNNIWTIFYLYLDDGYKKAFYNYVEGLKIKGALVKYRINILHKYKPLNDKVLDV